jgi:hypothetical protein
MLPKSPGRRTRRSIDQTRELMLRAGADLVFAFAEEAGDEVAASVLAHVRMTDVAARATTLDPGSGGVTTGSLYQLWPTQAEFQADLLFHLIGLATAPAGEQPLQQGIEQLAAGAQPLTALAAMVDLDYRITLAAPETYVDLASYVAANHPGVRDALRSSYEFLSVRCRAFYELLMRIHGRRLAQPYTVDMLSAALVACVEGYILRARVNPEAVPEKVQATIEGTPVSGSIVALTAVGIYLSMTEPLSASQPTAAP